MKSVNMATLREALEEVDAWVEMVEKVEATRPTETVIALWEAQSWKMLDYPSWEALCASRGWTRNVLPMVERREVVAELRQEGMSTRAIAAATGVSHPTVMSDLRSAGKDLPPEPVRGTDGKTYAPTQPASHPIRPAVVSTPEPEPEPVEVLTVDEWKAREGYEQPRVDEPDPDDFLPEQSKFERRFWQHLRQAQELVTDLDYPHHFNEPMTRLLLDLIESLNEKRAAVANPGLRASLDGLVDQFAARSGRRG